MTNRVDGIISALDVEFTEPPSSRNSVMALDGEIVRINHELWEKSPVLRAHASCDVSQKVLAAPKRALEALKKAHQHGIFPTAIRDSYELLAAASELRLEELTSECLENLRTLNAFDESVDLPPELPIDAVMRVFNILLSGPLRTVDIYRSQLSRIARYCANNRDVMTNAMNLLRQSLEKFEPIDLEGIPASFGVRTLPVAVYKRMGELQTAVIIGDQVRPVNLFGNRINLGDIRGDGFYLKYGVYLLYLRDMTVHYKYLLDYSRPKEVLSDCFILLNRGNFVLAVQNQKNISSISLWTDDVKFKKIHQSPGMILQVEFDHNTRLLAAALSIDRIRLFKFENRTLFPSEEIIIQNVMNISLSGRNMYISRGLDSRIWIETHRVGAIGDAGSSQSIAPKKFRSSGSLFPVYHAGGCCFLRDSWGLKLVSNFPSLNETRTLMPHGTLVGLSELWMSP